MPNQLRLFSLPKSLANVFGSGSVTPARSSQQIVEADIRPQLMGEIPRPAGITFAGQDELPRLPIPSLESTCQKYLAALKPLQDPREHAETNLAVYEFLHHDGPQLQAKLQDYAKDKISYIEQFWYDSYLNFDNPVVLNLNPFFLLEDDPTPARNNQVTRAASLVVSALEFVRAVRREELPPDMLKGKPLDMYQYSRLFGTARVPSSHGCQIEQDPDSKHIVVICHGQFYWFDVLDDNSDLIMTEKDISINLQTIVNDAAQTPIQDAAKGALGVLSTENRKIWSRMRDTLTREEGSNNADCLGIIDSALFVLCLDYTEPLTAAALCQNMLCGTNVVQKGVQIGTCINRWYDKLQIIVCKNGSAGINFEHTGVDGHTVLRFASDVYTDTILRFARTINGQAPSLWKTTSPDPSKRDPESFGDVTTSPHKLEWDMIPELNVAVRFAETRLADLIGQTEFECLDFSGFGKNFITSSGLSPDAFVQMAFQAAYYGLYGRVECTYEPAMTKMFLHGRTEAVRSVTEESVEFLRTFWGDNPEEQKVAALRKACQKHVDNTKQSAKAEGCDRHLYALYNIWQKSMEEDHSSASTTPGDESPPGDTEDGLISSTALTDNKEPVKDMAERPRADSNSSRSREPVLMPRIFSDGGWEKLNQTILSTSNCGNPSLRQFGFGPTSGDGFGIGYIIKDEGINVCVSSKHRQTKRFLDTLESYLLEIRRVLRVTNRRTMSHSKQSRAREIDAPHSSGGDKGLDSSVASLPPPRSLKARGRMISSGLENIRGPARPSQLEDEKSSPAVEDGPPTNDDGLGGYGFFDAGMLLQALKARDASGAATPSGTATDPDTGLVGLRGSPSAAHARRRGDIGKKLRLVEY
ncbi:carnitine acetyl transferase [Microdochium trichocladiopsis]|uniref:Carnitine acetyl transferase n=1 Tax=Microdochium trichocladiopsis TaxID=1682393 RepID=A0A9P8YI45_9PEZI|nr:carnitine acetyl transferase [Microdochium trichocladiopsis]KAH7040433.1 carnitine acetyl transferase [Microdochium trichocladiopsis]